MAGASAASRRLSSGLVRDEQDDGPVVIRAWSHQHPMLNPRAPGRAWSSPDRVQRCHPRPDRAPAQARRPCPGDVLAVVARSWPTRP